MTSNVPRCIFLHLVFALTSVVAGGEEVNVKAASKTLESLKFPLVMQFDNETVSEILAYLSTAIDADFRVESGTLLSQRVSMNIGAPGEPGILILRRLLTEHDYEMSVMMDGRILVKPIPPAVVAARSALMALQSPASEVSWRKKAQLMTENGFMEQAGNLVWRGHEQAGDHKELIARADITSVFERHMPFELATLGGTPPFGSHSSHEERQKSCRARNELVIRVLSRLQGKVFPFLDELDTLLRKHDVHLVKSGICNFQTVQLADDRALVAASGVSFEFRRMGGDWKLHHTVSGSWGLGYWPDEYKSFDR